MFTASLAAHNGEAYRVTLRSVTDIVDLVRDTHLESLTSADGEMDFWITPSSRPFHRRVNASPLNYCWPQH